MRTAPFFLGTNTMPAHHSVNSSTIEMTPICSILSNFRNFNLKGVCRWHATQHLTSLNSSWRGSAYSAFQGPSSTPSLPSFSPLPRNVPAELERKRWERREKRPGCLNGILFEIFLDR